MAESVYVLCFLTSSAVALLLLRAWSRSRHRILFWSGLGFVGLALNNAMLIIDLMVVGGQIDLSVARQLPALIGLSLMLYGMIFDERKTS